MSKKRSTVIPPLGSPGCAGGSTEGGCAPSLGEPQSWAEAWGRIARAAETFFQHHGHHPDESCCDDCEPLKDAIWKAQPGPFGPAWTNTRERPEGPPKAIRSVIDQERSALDHPLWEEKE